MKEIKTLMQQLREYPNNFFVHPGTLYPIKDGLKDGHTDFTSDRPIKNGLVVCNHLGEEQGFIETGGKEGVVIEA
ncbi:hypothetical protein LCGC14_3070240 [marine sediment metagenome]|uniref:Uncharacterized protein n=1 Tax=marine sediment metagenome TaxID=412755 RepID=A0A0F8YP14_9ZZZZ